MVKDKTIGVVIPSYNEETQISSVITTIPDFVDKIVVVDDKSTDKTIERATRFKADPKFANRLVILPLPVNEGVGGAIAAGYRWCRDNKIDVTAVMAGDGQMAPGELINIVTPVVEGNADYVKGNRLLTENSWKTIPRTRFIGNAALSFLTKIVSGYWSVVDSQTGYTAISLLALQTLNLENIYKRYGVPNDILTKLNIYNFRIAQIPVEPVYNVGEKSKMIKSVVFFTISFLLFRLFWYRMFYKYVVRDFHPVFLYYTAGILFSTIGILGGLVITAVDILIRTHMIHNINVPYGWMLLFTSLLLSGINMVFFGMWMDRDENKALQINILPQGKRL